MKIKFKEDTVLFEDEKGGSVSMTTAQLMEFIRVINVVFTEDGIPMFSVLEFKV